MSTIHNYPAHKNTPSGPYPQCIFCGDDTDPDSLTLEHAIPEAMGGRIVLKQATCLACLYKINPYEGKCLNKMFAPILAYLGIPKVKPKRRYPISLVFGREFRSIRIPIREHPMALVLLNIAPPGLMMGLPPGNAFTANTMTVCEADGFDAKVARLKEKYGASDVNFAAHFDPDAFGRCLAKMAHCLAIHAYGLGSFRPYLKEIILGTSDIIPYFVGSADPIAPGDQPGHRTALSIHEGPNKHLVLVCFIRLFAWLDQSPTYQVVVGEPSEELKQRLKSRDA